MDREIITTKSVGYQFVDIPQEFILEETAKTRTVFKAEMSPKGVRGRVIRYRKNPNGDYEGLMPVNFNELHPDDGIKIDLATDALRILYEKIAELSALLESHGITYGEKDYVITDASALMITDENKASIIKNLLDKNLGEDIWQQFTVTNPDIATKLAYSQIQISRSEVLKQFEEMLADDALTEEAWQKFFDKNKWIFGYGLRYQIMNTTQSQPNYGGADVSGRGGERGDFLLNTVGDIKFTCLVEIKRPKSKLLRPQKYRNGAYAISEEVSGAIAQVQENCAEWEISGSRSDRNRDLLSDIYTVSPKGIVIIGRSSELNDRNKRNSFERYRRSLHNPEIITFDELFERAKFIVGESQIDTSDSEDDFDFPF